MQYSWRLPTGWLFVNGRPVKLRGANRHDIHPLLGRTTTADMDSLDVLMFWAHPACYVYQTLQTGPNIREFWGQSIDLMWSNLFDSPGGLGGAIWGYGDETFMLPVPKVGVPWWKEFARPANPEDFQGNCIGYGEWGIVDVWRRKKPEFWSAQKAYSPVRLLLETVTEFTHGQRIILPVYNRFDHTRLDEIKAYTII